MADFMESIRDLPVKSATKPGEILDRLESAPPLDPEPFERIFEDFQSIVLPGMTHWQHPSFHAYFPANSSPPSLLAEMLTATLGAQCMSWATSPAATELEERMIEWLRQMIGVPTGWSGVIQDTASTATLCSLLTAREQATGFGVNRSGFAGNEHFRVYCSAEAHSSVEKAVRIAGIGGENLVRIPVDNRFALRPADLVAAIEADRTSGFRPLAVVATVGTTGSTAVDPVRAIGEICRRESLWLHVDAAFAGNALILPEMRWMADGLELADSLVFNPHKWLLTNFDCSAHFVKDPAALVRTFEMTPEYLKTAEANRVKNYRDWGIQLGRRFRALKLWFVIRSYGVAGLQAVLRSHIALARSLAVRIDRHTDFELMAPTVVALVCFRCHPAGVDDPIVLDRLNEVLLERVNASGRCYISHTRLAGLYTLRLHTGQTQVTAADVDRSWELICTEAARLG